MSKKDNKDSKVIFLVNNFLLGKGGGKIIIPRIINNLGLKKTELTFISLEIGVEKQVFKDKLGNLDRKIEFIPIFSPDILNPRILKTFWRLGKIIRQRDPEIIFTTAGHHIKAVLFFMARLMTSAKIIFGEHSPHPPHINFKSFINKVLYMIADKTIIKFAYPRADKIVFISKEQMKVTKKRYNLKDDKICTIYNPIVTESMPRKAQQPVDHSWFKEDIPIILSVGRLDPYQKDFPTFLKAFAKLRSDLKARLVIIGEGPQKEDLKELAEELGISNDVYFTGYQENPYKYMSKADVFVLSSNYEGNPTVLVEAMACGVPVVSSSCFSGPKEVLKNGKYGKLVPIGDASEMARAIAEILSDKELAQDFIAKGKERIQNFTVERSASQYEELFNTMLGKS